jgi:hypothetical protein
MTLCLPEDHAWLASESGRGHFLPSACKFLYQMISVSCGPRPAHGLIGKPFLLAVLLLAGPLNSFAETVRFATYNVSLYANRAGEVADRLAGGDDKQAAAEAEIIQRINPDVLLLNEVDYDTAGQLIDTFQKKYMEIGQNASMSPANFF